MLWSSKVCFEIAAQEEGAVWGVTHTVVMKQLIGEEP